jgi:hypothetical protein
MPFEGKNVLTVGCQGYAKEKHLSSPKWYTKHGKGRMAQQGIGVGDCGVDVLDPLIYFP